MRAACGLFLAPLCQTARSKCNRSCRPWAAPGRGPGKTYGKQFCASGYNKHTEEEEFRGAKNLPTLHKLLTGSVLIRRRKKDVLKDLPPLRHELVPLRIPEGSEGKKLREVLQAERAAIPVETRTHWVKAIGAGKAPALEECSELRHALAHAKIPIVTEYLTDLLKENQGERLLLFGHHPDCMDALCDALHQKGFAGQALHGRNSKQQDRQVAVDEFATGSADFLLAGISVLKEGVDGLQRGSSTCIFVEPSWSPGELTQAAARLHRIGQANAVLAMYLVVEKSLEAYMMTTALRKAEHANIALDGGNA